jgi:multicomponent Na+:H+ antiporter subunit G
MVGRMFVLVGSLLILLAAVGMVRFDDVFARLHALANASTAGLLVVLAGAAVTLHHANDITSAALAGILQLLTSPVAANMISIATYRTEGSDAPVHQLDRP